MSKQPDLPQSLPRHPFTIAQARAAGLEYATLRSRALQRPFYAVRSRGLDLSELLDRCRAYSAHMASDAVFSHTTAARIWQLPLPLAIPDELHVTVSIGHRAPEGAVSRGHQQRIAAAEHMTHRGLAVASPAATWAQVAELVALEDLTAIGEHMITGNPYEKRLPLATLTELTAAAAVRSRGPGHRRRMLSLKEMTDGAFSRPETHVRLLLERCGIPRALINADVLGARGEFIAMPDLQWPEFRVALEYQGDGHRTARRFRRDIARLEKLIDADWLVIQVTAAELYSDPRVIVERVARRLASRGWWGRIRLRQLTTFVP